MENKFRKEAFVVVLFPLHCLFPRYPHQPYPLLLSLSPLPSSFNRLILNYDVHLCVCRKASKDTELKSKLKASKKAEEQEKINLDATRRMKEDEASVKYEEWLKTKVSHVITGTFHSSMRWE